MTIKDFINKGLLLTDGAMGTFYESNYPYEEGLVEAVSIEHPERIKNIHRAYLEAGANLLRTNTFAINSSFFPSYKNRQDLVKASYSIAWKAVKEYCADNDKSINDFFVAADIGTLYDLGDRSAAELVEEYKELVDAFLDEGASLFWLETQSDFLYIEEITDYIKEKKADAFVMVSFSFDKTGYTRGGISLRRMMQAVSMIASIDAYGMNCGIDAAHALTMLDKQAFVDEKPFIVVPNAGYPSALRGRIIYGQNEGYFAERMVKLAEIGVDILGGCCGTSPIYISKLKKALEGHKKANKKIVTLETREKTFSKSRVARKLLAGEKPFIVELDPPFDTDVNKVMNGARALKDIEVDLLTLSDSPLARTRMDPNMLAAMVQKETGIQIMPHMTCRDRNIISLRGTLLGGYINDIRHYLFVTGDPVNKFDRSITSQVFDINSIRMMNMAQEMNEDVFLEDKIIYAGALNYHGVNADGIVAKMKKKMEQGCLMFLTQPIYSDEDIERIAYLREKTGAKIMAGIMPLVSYKNAQFMANEMPGIRVPEYIVSAYKEDMTKEEAQHIAVEISLEIADKLKDVSDGYYFMVPFNRVAMICEIIEKIRAKER